MERLADLEEYNSKKLELWSQHLAEAHLSGIACPKCRKKGKEVEMHEDSMGINCVYPPNVNITCPECDYRDYRQL